MKKGRIISIIGLALLGALMWRSGSLSETPGESGLETTETPGSSMGHPEGADKETFKTKVADRPPASPAATHSPERLKDFFLPALNIEGLSLEEAMRKLKTSYEETCQRTGEVPINLRFDIPRESSGKITIRLEGKSFNSAVKLLATLSGMTVSRKGSEYQFALIPDELVSKTRMFTVPPDFADTLGALGNTRAEKEPFADTAPSQQLPVSLLLGKLGLELDSSTLLRPTSTGELMVMTTNAADLVVIDQLIGTLADEKPMQLKFKSTLVKLKSGMDFELPDTSQMTGGEAQAFMRGIAQRKGTDVMTLPSMVTGNGQPSSIKVGRDYVQPKDGADGEFETHFVGNAMQLEGSALGFGQETAFNYTHTSANEESAGEINIREQIDVSDSGYSNDQGTRFAIQENPDGTKVIVLVTATLVDPTGEPLHGVE